MYCERTPRQLPQYMNILSTFDLASWIGIWMSLMLISATMYVLVFFDDSHIQKVSRHSISLYALSKAVHKNVPMNFSGLV